ncbi:biotin--[acetyl-CoA-carboxylase] ligase [Clostridium carnis]
MKEKILNLLKNHNDYLSGQTISDNLGITRASVWKYINILKKEGYKIEGISNKGYKLLPIKDLLNPIEIKSNLNTTYIGKNIKYFSKINSTNTFAKSIAYEEPNGTLIISEVQTDGKGRLDRDWSSPKGGIWASLLLKPNLEPIQAPKITQIAAAALTLTLKNYNLDIKIKWPNDLLLNNKKFCGILTEMSCDMDRINYIILGFGININISKEEIPDNLINKATSLSIESSKNFNRVSLLCDFLKNFEDLFREILETNDAKTSIEICKNNSLIIGKEISLLTRFGEESVICMDILPSGSLLVKNKKGEEKIVMSGEVSLSNYY